MKEKIVPLTPYLLILAADFYLLPCLIRDTGLAMLVMLCVMPAVAFVTAAAWGVRRGFSLFPALAAAALFVPTIWIYYNSSAWVYAPAYGVIALVGTALGRIFFGKR